MQSGQPPGLSELLASQHASYSSIRLDGIKFGSKTTPSSFQSKGPAGGGGTVIEAKSICYEADEISLAWGGRFDPCQGVGLSPPRSGNESVRLCTPSRLKQTAKSQFLWRKRAWGSKLGHISSLGRNPEKESGLASTTHSALATMKPAQQEQGCWPLPTALSSRTEVEEVAVTSVAGKRHSKLDPPEKFRDEGNQ